MNVRPLLKIFTYILVLSALSFFTLNTTLAQEIPTPNYSSETPSINQSDLLLSEKIPGIQEQVDVKITPENPKPGEETTIEIDIYGGDINGMPIIWKVNGVEKSRGVGLRRFKFTNGNTGSVTKVDVSIIPKSGNAIEQSFSFAPIDVDILWQAKTYTPPFYKGKALYTPESEVEITSIPNAFSDGKKINPGDMVYKWKLNYELDDSVSGFNKNTYYFKGPIILRENFIQNSVYSAANPEIQGSNKLSLNHVNPQVLLYEENPSLGVLFNKAIAGEYTLDKPEVKISAYPLFYSTPHESQKVSYVWDLDGNKIEIPSYQNSVIFRRKNSIKGSASIKVLITNPKHILQRSASIINLLYEK
ncbi:MAG: hypothetical protein FGM57_03280 [Candidatus Taylorbacteria bacterium]|nr:hypothetical protein [Candidatus Taylorbacteria bacterium]